MSIKREMRIKEDIENVLRQMCFGRSREWSEDVVNKIFGTYVIYHNCILDDIVVDEDMIVSALIEIVYEEVK